MNPDLSRLQPYPFERLAQLYAGVKVPGDLAPIALSIGEPTHATPAFITEEVITHLHGLSNYPTTRGIPALRAVIAAWLTRRFELPGDSLDPERHILPVNGTREALFAFAQCALDRTTNPVVLMPNPFYQIYEGAALLAGAEPVFMNTTAATGYLPDLDSIPAAVWSRCQLVYICTPGNPTGAVMDSASLQKLIQLSDRHDFIIAADECYSEIYPDETAAPPGLLQAAAAMGRDDYSRCMVFHSLSKRSNAPGLRSGFVAGDARLIEAFLRYRTYHGCAMPPATQAASIRAWEDETHVADNRALYREKFSVVLEILAPVLDVQQPPAGFYLWPVTPIDDCEFARGLLEQQNVRVLPGSYLSRSSAGINPGNRHVRMALVAPLEDCIEAAQRIKSYLVSLQAAIISG
ncbi:MAG: succinyldiaminopimelate transaminase [Gammaproteobacteria bacterium]|nr:succinyldiaminopimelate transaminase [Gammaproteobacteria bacterium]